MERLKEVYNLIKHEAYQKKPLHFTVWAGLSDEDKTLIKRYAEEPSNFDGDNFRINAYKRGPLSKLQLGDHTIYTIGSLTGAAARSVIKQINKFSRVLQIMGSSKSYTIYWFLSPVERKFPSHGEPVLAKHINGGYCHACKPETIVIYRAEDAVRVLIHELMHAACLDDHSKPIPVVEAETEAWAELFYSMLMANEYGLSPGDAWNIQSSWSARQNIRLQKDHSVKGPSDYAWRYTVGKEGVWRRWNMPVAPPSNYSGNSLSLGAPENFFEKSSAKN